MGKGNNIRFVVVSICCAAVLVGIAFFRMSYGIADGEGDSIVNAETKKQNAAADKETVYGKNGDPICRIKRKYDDDGNLVREKRKILSAEYDTNAESATEYPVAEVDKYKYKDGVLRKEQHYRDGVLMKELTWDKNGDLKNITENKVVPDQIVQDKKTY